MRVNLTNNTKKKLENIEESVSLWHHSFREVYWRLMYNGLPTAARLHRPHESCACGAPQPGREHHYWSCAAARAVTAQLSAVLGVPISRAASHRLAQPPTAAMHPGVWGVVVLAALGAMDSARRLLIQHRLRQHTFWPWPPALETAKSAAVAKFWTLLVDFASASETLPPRWQGRVGPDHPFLCSPNDSDIAVLLPA